MCRSMANSPVKKATRFACGVFSRHGVLKLCVGASLLLLATAPATAEEPEIAFDRDQEVTIDAEELSYDRRADTVSASGKVEIRHGETLLRAERVEVNRKTEEALASGGAVLTDPNVTIRAREMHLNLTDETGMLSDVEIESETLGYSLRGGSIEKKEGQRYRILDGLFTTCNCDDPSDPPPWSVSGDELNVDLEGYGDVRGGRFRVNDVPILYVPRAAFPTSQERQSGLLFPRLGLSNRRGLQILQPFYWAIDKSQDATLSLDIESAQRFGLIAEHRYALNRESGGEMQVMYFNESVRGSASETTLPGLISVDVPQNRFGIAGQHSYKVGNSEVYADVLFVADDLFLREINTFTLNDDEDVTLRTRPFTTSRVGAIRRWDRAYGRVEGVFHQNLLGREAYVLQGTPEIGLAAQTQLGGGLLASLDATAVNFERSTGITGLRVDLSPRLELRLPLGRSVNGSLSAAFRESAYALTQDEMFGGFNGEASGAAANTLINLPTTSSRETFEMRAKVGTGFVRVFDFSHLGFERLKHTIEPEMEYLLIPSVNQDEHPIFDGEDRLPSRNVLSYGFSSRVLAKREAPPPVAAPEGMEKSDRDDELHDQVFELAKFSLVQSHDFTHNVPQRGSIDEKDQFSDIDFSMRLNPVSGTSVRLESTYDVATADLTSATVGILLREPGWLAPRSDLLRWVGRSSFGLDYRFIADNNVPGTSAVEQIDSTFRLRLTDRVGFRYSGRFNLAANRLLSNFFGFSYLSACDCWSLDLGISDRSNPNEVQFQVQMRLLGFGSAEGGSRSGVE